MAFRRASYCCLALLLLLYLAAALAAGTSTSTTTTGGPQPQASRGRSSNPSPRLPRTSASQLSAQNNTTATRGTASRNLTNSAATSSQAAQSRGNYRTRRDHGGITALQSVSSCGCGFRKMGPDKTEQNEQSRSPKHRAV
uniref:Uncharacterized protein n=1 Tax=Anopheles merus TaxID=30066 RepID=A0A182VF23_ANOME